MKFKNILLVIAIIIVVIGTSYFLMLHQADPRQDSQIAITSAANLTEGDTFSAQLTDLNGTPIAGESLNITIFDSSGGVHQMVLTTDERGNVSFEVNGTIEGSCVVKIKFGGNDAFNGCNLTQNVVFNKKVVPVINITNITSNLGRNTSSHSSYSGYETNSYSSYSEYETNSYGSDDVVTV